MNVPIELDDEEIMAIPQDKRIRIIKAQIEGGSDELKERYEQFQLEKDQLAELEYRLEDLKEQVNGEKKKLQYNQKAKDKISAELLKLRDTEVQLETKLKSLSTDGMGSTIKDSEIERLAQQLEKEDMNVLRYQAQIEKRRNEIATIDAQFEGEMDDMKYQLQVLSDERSKTLDLIGLEMQRLSLLKQRNEASLKSTAAHSLDSQLTTALESFVDDE